MRVPGIASRCRRRRRIPSTGSLRSSRAPELAIAALAARPDPASEIEERERLASGLRALGLEPLESHTNFLYVPVDDGLVLGEALLRQGLVVRAYPEAIRASVRDA